MMKALNLKLVVLLEYQNIKNIFTKGYVLNWSEVFVIATIKNRGHMSLVISEEKKLLEHFTKKEMQKSKSKRILC